MRLDWNLVLATILFLAGTSPLHAQSGSVSDDFENGTGTWTISGGANGVTWAADGTPSGVLGGAAYAGLNSLNYNNGTDYSGTSTGAATTPVYTLDPSGSPVLTFYCNFETESEDASWAWDIRQITITPGTGSAITEPLGVTNAGTTVGPCQAMGSWHLHTIPLDSSWGTVQVSFNFDSVDDYMNEGSGWFIDTFSVSGVTTTGGGSTGGGSTGGGKPTVIQEWNFDSGLGSWTVAGSDASVTWAADGAPTAVANAATFVSSPNSLNYNNGVDYDSTGVGNNGTATSPMIDLSNLTDPRITFTCNYETETLASYDQRFFQVSNDGFTGTPLVDEQLLSTGANAVVGDCGTAGSWHTHSVILDPSWGTVEIRFAFDSIDELNNNYAGWFVDDVSLLATGGSGSTQNSPGTGSDRDNDNGDNAINDTLCAGALAGSNWSALSLMSVLAGMLLLALSRRVRA